MVCDTEKKGRKRKTDIDARCLALEHGKWVWECERNEKIAMVALTFLTREERIKLLNCN